MPHKTTLTLLTLQEQPPCTIMTLESCSLSFWRDMSMFMLRESLVSPVAAGRVFLMWKNLSCVSCMTWSLRLGDGGRREWGCLYLGPDFSVYFLRHLAIFLLSGSRGFCLVKGSSTHPQEQVPKDTFWLDEPLALWMGWDHPLLPPWQEVTKDTMPACSGGGEKGNSCILWNQRQPKSCFCWSHLKAVNKPKKNMTIPLNPVP